MQFKSVEASQLSAPLCIKKIYSIIFECRKYQPRLKRLESSADNITNTTITTPPTTTTNDPDFCEKDSTKTAEMISRVMTDDSIDIVVVTEN